MSMSQRSDDASMLAEAVRAACLEAALLAYEDAGIRGLCAEGRWESAVAAMRHVDLRAVLDRPAAADVTRSAPDNRSLPNAPPPARRT